MSAAISMHRFWVATAIFALVAALCKPVAADATDRPENVFRPLASGEIEMQIGQITEIIMAPGIELVGPLPPEIRNTTVLAAGVVAGSKTPERATALINFLSTSATAAALQADGFQPAYH